MRRVCAAMLLLLVSTLPAAAQRTTGEIIGKVADQSGSVLPGVTVTLRGAGVAGAPTVVTSESGSYRFPVLPPGTYEVEYALQGFTTLKREAIPISVGSIVGMTAYMVGTQLANHHTLSPILAVLLAIGLGAFLGLINGLIIAYGRVPAIITTLGTLAIYRTFLVDYSN